VMISLWNTIDPILAFRGLRWPVLATVDAPLLFFD
jgi:hypothetical protein